MFTGGFGPIIAQNQYKNQFPFNRGETVEDCLKDINKETHSELFKFIYLINKLYTTDKQRKEALIVWGEMCEGTNFISNNSHYEYINSNIDGRMKYYTEWNIHYTDKQTGGLNYRIIYEHYNYGLKKSKYLKDTWVWTRKYENEKIPNQIKTYTNTKTTVDNLLCFLTLVCYLKYDWDVEVIDNIFEIIPTLSFTDVEIDNIFLNVFNKFKQHSQTYSFIFKSIILNEFINELTTIKY